MIDLEIPLGKRTKAYRFFEILPAILSYGAIALLIVLSLVSPLAAAIYLMLVVVTLLVKAVGIGYDTIAGHHRLTNAQKINWHERLADFEDPVAAYAKAKNGRSHAFGFAIHQENLRLAAADPAAFPKPSEIYNAVMIATYNESYDVLEPTIRSVLDTTYDNDHIILVIAYEQRGPQSTKDAVVRLQKEFKDKFFAFEIVEHPKNLPNEVIGKGGNITYAGHYLKHWCDEKGIEYKNVIVTTLDSDNRPHKVYFDYLTYEFIAHEDRKHLSYQPVALYLTNIWDVPAPMRVIATGNSFWTVISAMRPHTLRNFAAHSQPMEALVEMNFWSTRTIVEDGHQYYRSFFYFDGNYDVIPIYAAVYQDAVLADTYGKTLKAQFVQLRRWAYGASDIPYVATRLFSRKRTVPFFTGFARLLRLIDGNLTLASVSILVTVGGWVPLLINSQSYRNVVAHELPDAISMIQRFALVGLLITIFLAFRMLPPRPERYKRHRTLLMAAQWVLMPVTSILYNAFAAYYSQTRLALGKYLDRFDVTVKATAGSVEAAKAARKAAKKK